MCTVVIGDGDVARMACAVITDQGGAVTHLLHPTEPEVRAALDDVTGNAAVDAVAVLVRSDVSVLRYALLVEHLRPGIRLVATIFDRTLATELVRAVPNCQVTSPADTSIPSIIGACIGGGALALADTPGGPSVVHDDPSGVTVRPYHRRRRGPRGVAAMLASQLRPHDDATRILLAGLSGLVGILLLAILLGTVVLHQGVLWAFYLSTRVVATVGPDNITRHTMGWYVVVSSLCMLLTIAFTAVFTAGIVNRLLSSRSIGLVGRRTMPTSGHVVVVGLGQVGLRLAVRLKDLGVPVVVVERDPVAGNLRLARAAGVPVLIAHAEDRAVLRSLGLTRAVALAAMGSDELDNIEVAINALADAPALRVVLRAGEDDVVAGTQSLFRIGEVCDVSALTALAVYLGLGGRTTGLVYPRHPFTASFDGGHEVLFDVRRRCSCTPLGPATR